MRTKKDILIWFLSIAGGIATWFFFESILLGIASLVILHSGINMLLSFYGGPKQKK